MTLPTNNYFTVASQNFARTGNIVSGYFTLTAKQNLSANTEYKVTGLSYQNGFTPAVAGVVSGLTVGTLSGNIDSGGNLSIVISNARNSGANLYVRVMYLAN